MRENLERLYALLSQDGSQDPDHALHIRLLRAEAARQLGRFADALAILGPDAASMYQPIAETIVGLARRSDDGLAPVSFGRI